ncbi:unnamed protein product [Pedinophyceae sp. YPF-701]|nr:unnamed protein product [Pedinophyceae sp. YPF-701]
MTAPPASGPVASTTPRPQTAPEAAAAGGNQAGSENFWVGVRVRPHLRAEREEELVWECEENETEISFCGRVEKKDKYLPKSYAFDRVFAPQCPTADVYQAAARNLVLSAMEGVNGIVFAYGQTGSGKTFTMRGVMTQAVQEVFAAIHATPRREFLLRVSALEIYNEVVKDLLVGDAATAPPLRLLDDPRQGVQVEGLSEVGVSSEQELAHLLRQAEKRRHVRDTGANASSSRSHQVVRLYVESRPGGPGSGATPTATPRAHSASQTPRSGVPKLPLGATDLDGMEDAADAARDGPKGDVISSRLYFVDLAGSERARTAEIGDQMDSARLKEGSHINRSLLTLGSIIRELSNGNGRGHVPYRNSKLTRILQPSLSGNGRTAIICTVAPEASQADNTRNTLHFAQTAKKVTTRPMVNRVVDSEAVMRKLRREIGELRRQLAVYEDEGSLTSRLLDAQNTARLTAEQRDAAHRRLRNLERLILRAPPGTIKRRASWSPGNTPVHVREAEAAVDAGGVSPPHGGSPANLSNVQTAALHGASRRGGAAAGLRRSWNPGDTLNAAALRAGARGGAFRSPLAALSDDSSDDGSDEDGRAGGQRAGNASVRRRLFPGTFFLDIFLTPDVQRRMRRLGASNEGPVPHVARHASGSISTPSAGQSPARYGAAEDDIDDEDDGGSNRVGRTGLPRDLAANAAAALVQTTQLGDAEKEALQALQAEVRCMKHSRVRSWAPDTSLTQAAAARGARTPGRLSRQPSGAAEGGTPADQQQRERIRALEMEVERMEQERVIGEFLDKTHESTIEALRSELHRLQLAQHAEATASRALASLQQKITRGVSMSLTPSQLPSLAGGCGPGNTPLSPGGVSGRSCSVQWPAAMIDRTRSNVTEAASPLHRQLHGAGASQTSGGEASFGVAPPRGAYGDARTSEGGGSGASVVIYSAEGGGVAADDAEGVGDSMEFLERSPRSALVFAPLTAAARGRPAHGAEAEAGGGAATPMLAESPTAAAVAAFAGLRGARRADLLSPSEGDCPATSQDAGGVLRDSTNRSPKAGPKVLDACSVGGSVSAGRWDAEGGLDGPVLDNTPSNVPTPPGEDPWAAAQGWYERQLAQAQEDIQKSFEADFSSIKQAFTDFNEQIARLECQKRLLLNQVIRLEMEAEDAASRERKLQRQAKKREMQLADAKQRASMAAAAASVLQREREREREQGGGKLGGVAEEGAGGEADWMEDPWGESRPDDESWALAPSAATLMPRILRLWEELHTPLVHRSRFVLGFRGKETFYFEVEHRRLTWERSKLDGPGPEAREARRALQHAATVLEEERKWLAGEIRRRYPRGEARDQLYRSFGVDLSDKNRKVQLTARLWSRTTTSDAAGVHATCRLVLRLYGERPSDHMFEAVFNSSRADEAKPRRAGWLAKLLPMFG